MLTAERARQVLFYDHNTGLFTWKSKTANRANRIPPGHAAGTVNTAGYTVITIDKRRYMAHRLAWLYMTGEWPREFIDHINLNKSDNKFANLRQASRSQNGMNRDAGANNSSGSRGVSWRKDKKKWRAYICMGGKDKWLGNFDKKEDAETARRLAESVMFGEYARC